MKNFLALFAMLVSMNFAVAAQSTVVDVSKLTAEQQAQVLSMVQLANTPQNKVVDTVDKVDKVVNRIEEFGASAARGLVGFAKEIGTEANNFAQTPLGMVVAGFTVLHFFGHEITSLLVGFVFSFVISPILLWLFVKSFQTVDHKYEYKATLFGLYNKRVIVESVKRHMTDAEQIKSLVFGVALTISVMIGVQNFVI